MSEVAAPEVPNKTSTPGPTPAAFTRVVVDIFGTLDITPLQDALTPFLGARHFHEELERDWVNASASTITIKSGSYSHYPPQCGQPPMWHMTAPTGCSTNAWISATMAEVAVTNTWITVSLPEVEQSNCTRLFWTAGEVS